MTNELNRINPKCPYYGFYLSRGIMVDTYGNQCALIINSYSPCQMEMNKENPDWNKCSFIGNKERIELILAEFMVFPRGVSEGTRLEDWCKHIME